MLPVLLAVPLASLPIHASLPIQETPAAPAVERGLRLDTPEATPGFVLFAPLRSRSTFLVDRRGEVVHTWPSEHPGLAVYMLDDGTLLRTARIDDNPTFHGGGLGGRIQRVAKDGGILWDYVLSDAKRSLHHDIEPLANGNVLAIAWEHLSKDEAVALGRDPAATNEKGWWPCWVLEIRPTPPSGGEIVWEWHAKDHLIQDADPAKPNHGAIPDHPGRIDVNADHRDTVPLSEEERRAQAEREAEMRALGYSGGDEDEDDGAPPADGKQPPKSGDWLHLNGIDHDPVNDLILLSNPEFNELWIIDHSTTTAEARGSRGGRFGKGGDLLWRWGNPRMYGRGEKEDRQLFYQHQAEWVPPGRPGAGHVTVFNNGSERPVKEYSSVEELVLPFDPKKGFALEPGQPFLPVEPVWSYSDPENFYSFFISGCHRLANGNTFVCSGKQGRFFELSPAGKIVWEYWNPHGGEVEMGMGRAAPPPQSPPAGTPPAPGGGGNPVEPTSCFRATKLAPEHPGLRALGIVQ
ncbi:MAG TPA: aryl-sulfate sulfotransferase [Planctomycetota bacterium]